MKLHAVADPCETHERERRLPRANTELPEPPRDEVFAVADPTRERLRDVCPTLVPFLVLRVRNAALVEPWRFRVQTQVPRVRRGKRLDQETKDDLARSEIKQVESESEAERVRAQPSPPSSTSPYSTAPKSCAATSVLCTISVITMPGGAQSSSIWVPTASEENASAGISPVAAS